MVSIWNEEYEQNTDQNIGELIIVIVLFYRTVPATS